jgi:hypothetical protein
LTTKGNVRNQELSDLVRAEIDRYNYNFVQRAMDTPLILENKNILPPVPIHIEQEIETRVGLLPYHTSRDRTIVYTRTNREII